MIRKCHICKEDFDDSNGEKLRKIFNFPEPKKYRCIQCFRKSIGAN